MPTHQIIVRSPATGRVYLHGEQYADRRPEGNVPNNFFGREQAVSAATAVRGQGKAAEVA